MNYDFYVLGTPPTFDEAVEFGHISHNEQSLKNKVILVEASDYNLPFLKSLKSTQFSGCVFVYHFGEELHSKDWFEVFNDLPPFQVIATNRLSQKILKMAQEHLRTLEQESQYQNMLHESERVQKSQNDSLLKDLKKEDERTEKAIKRAKQVKFEEELNLKALELIFDLSHIGDIEDELLENLREPLGLKWLRILVSPNDHLQDLPIIKYQKLYQTKIYPLDYFNKKQGSVIFAFDKKKKIKINTGLLLQRVTDALSLRIKQLSVQSEIESTTHQWESTFEALPFKAAVIDKNYNIVQKGGEFKDVTVTGPCYKTFFNKDKPCAGCKLGESFLIDQKNESLEVISKKTFDPVADDYYYLNFYRDFEVSSLGETRKATKSKLEELGIISGSIAHELNNPLGGIKILLELLEEEEELQNEDIKEEIEILKESTSSCIHIVKELLSFTRPQKKGNAALQKSLFEYFKQLKTFTQAYLLSEGMVLQTAEKTPYLDVEVISPDATLPIRLLEAISKFAKENSLSPQRGQTRELYFVPEYKENKLFLNFTIQKIEPKTAAQAPSSPITLKTGHSKLTFDENKECLTIEFDLEVKTSATHV